MTTPHADRTRPGPPVGIKRLGSAWSRRGTDGRTRPRVPSPRRGGAGRGLRWFASAPVLCIVGLAIHAGPTYADVVTQPLTFGGKDLGWDAIYDNKPQGDGSSLKLDVEGIDRKTITLTKTVAFKNNDTPIGIKFVEVRQPALDETFFMLKEVATNNTAAKWSGFKYAIEDMNLRPSPVDPDGGDHPLKAHFHNKAWDSTSGPFKVTDPLINGGVYEMNLALNPGADPIGLKGSWTGQRLRMHDRIDPDPVLPGQNQPMKFALFEQPVAAAGVPEPSIPGLSVLVGLGLLVGTARHRLRKPPAG